MKVSEVRSPQMLGSVDVTPTYQLVPGRSIMRGKLAVGNRRGDYRHDYYSAIRFQEP